MVQPARRKPLKGARRIPMTLMLDADCHALLYALAVGTSRSALIEDLIRARARRRGITASSTPA
jgi:hypothetical protein